MEYIDFAQKRIELHEEMENAIRSLMKKNGRSMSNKQLNRIKVVLADKQRTNKWLAEQLGKDKTYQNGVLTPAN